MTYKKYRYLIISVVIALFIPLSASAADVITNGDFSSGTTGWTHVDIVGTTTMSSDASYGNPQPSLKDITGSGTKKDPYEWYDYQNTLTINSTDNVYLSLWWQKITTASIAQDITDIEVRIVKPSSAEVTIWSELSEPSVAGTPITGTVSNQNVSSDFDETGIYEIRLYANVQTGNIASSQIQINWDNVILDVQAVVANDPPVVSDIPDQIINEGQTFTTINLDDYVSDPDNVDADMTWSYTGNTELTVDITARVATITIPDTDWNGVETITFRATDPGALWDEDPATFTVNSQNDPPTLTNGTTAVSVSPINRAGAATTVISATFTDVDRPAVTVFNATFKILEPNNTTELTLVNNQPHGSGGLTIIDNGDDTYTANYTYNPDNAQTLGLYDLYFSATDGSTPAVDDYDNNLNECEIIETVNAPPVVTDIPDQTINEGLTFTTINLDDYVSDIDNNDADMTWTYSGNTELTVDITARVATITISSIDWFGAETITFRATDPGLLWDEDPATFTVNSQNDPPVVTDISNQTINEGQTFTTINLDDYVSDVDNVDADMTWSYTGNSALTVDITARVATITIPDIDWFGAETITFRATDPGALWDEDAATFTVNNLNDPPVVTDIPNQTINEGLTFTTINLDDYVSDIDNNDADMTWTYSGNTELTVDINARVATITIPSIDWFGAETITFRATDPGALWDDDPATFTVNALNDIPTITNGATYVTVSPVNRIGAVTTIIRATFTDLDRPTVSTFNATFKIREPNNITELTLVNNQTHGAGGLTIIDNGDDTYTALYTYDPADAQTEGLYDLYFEVTDGSTPAVDGYDNNLDELEINEILANQAPVVSDIPDQTINEGQTFATVNLDDYVADPDNNDNEMIWSHSGSIQLTVDITSRVATITIPDTDWNGAETITFRTTDPGSLWDDDPVTFTVNAQNDPPVVSGIPNQTITAGQSFATITLDNYVTDVDNTDAQMTWTYSGNSSLTVDITSRVATITTPSPVWTGMETITFRATDPGALWNEQGAVFTVSVSNSVPTITAGAITAAPGTVSRFGGATSTLSVDFTDSDQPAVSEFYVTFLTRSFYNEVTYKVTDSSQHGADGLTITDNGGGSYTATVDWNPPDNALLGFYDLGVNIADAYVVVSDDLANNNDELEVTNSGENSPPVVSADATYPTPIGVERIGANSVTISTDFYDGDNPAVSVFTVMIKVREPDNSTEIVLADDISHGTGGLTVTSGGGGNFTASISWDPPDAQTLGDYDLYFHVFEGTDTTFDGYSNNLDELELYDAISNNAPTLTSGNTFVLPVSISRVGSEFTMLKSAFSDADVPGKGAFTVTFKVRDQSNTEYTIVNASKHDENGLRIHNAGGGNYEASILWDPPIGQATGTYDLYFYVEDNNAAPATDDYASNGDELTITSDAILGDGNLLRRTHDGGTCGGSNSACHNIGDHQSQGCLTCHTAHGTSNIYLIRETIQTQSSGLKPVIFKTLGFDDPYNDPDPTVGDPNSGVPADSTDDVYTGICEVCHRTTKYHRNDGSQTNPNHNDAKHCGGCHSHADGFPGGGGEPDGGDGCSCHSAIVTPMSSSTSTYHHMINSTNEDYAASSKTCLMCHVHHDIFSPDYNTGIGQRGKNLRASINITPVQGDASVLANSDYSSTGDGGICLSCHTSTQTKTNSPPDGSTATIAIPKADFDASDAHNFSVATTFSDATSLNANCSKCHNDQTTKDKQTGTYKFSTHDGTYARILEPFSTASPTDPLEEDNCFGCHSGGVAGNDYYGVAAMTAGSRSLQAAFSRTYGHPTTSVRGTHKSGEVAADFADGNRHAECGDCHNVHAARKDNPLKGTWGVEPTSWPAAPTPTDNGNVFATPSAYSVVNPITDEWQLCLKCHSNYTTLPSGNRNIAAEINPNYPSTHGLTISNQNSYCNTTTMLEPWGSSGSTKCSDCHGSNVAGDPAGPHGSNAEHLLVATIVSDDQVGTPLCNVCHRETVYWSVSPTGSRYGQHPSARGGHQTAKGCFGCHMWDYADQAGLGVQNSEVFADGEVFVHGQNKKFVFKDDDGTTGTGDPVDAFINGYIADIDFSTTTCWSDENNNDCGRSHNGTGY